MWSLASNTCCKKFKPHFEFFRSTLGMLCLILKKEDICGGLHKYTPQPVRTLQRKPLRLLRHKLFLKA